MCGAKPTILSLIVDLNPCTIESAIKRPADPIATPAIAIILIKERKRDFLFLPLK
jgi:hypothetical protein